MGPAIEPEGAAAGAGFTLIELLICVAVLAVLAVAASLALPRAASPGARDMALFQAQFETARQLAMAGGQSRGLEITPQGLRAALHTHRGWQAPGRLLRWQGRAAFSAPRPALPGAPEIVLLANGRTSAFRISFGKSGSCESGGWAELRCAGG